MAAYYGTSQRDEELAHRARKRAKRGGHIASALTGLGGLMSAYGDMNRRKEAADYYAQMSKILQQGLDVPEGGEKAAPRVGFDRDIETDLGHLLPQTYAPPGAGGRRAPSAQGQIPPGPAVGTWGAVPPSSPGPAAGGTRPSGLVHPPRPSPGMASATGAAPSSQPPLSAFERASQITPPAHMGGQHLNFLLGLQGNEARQRYYSSSSTGSASLEAKRMADAESAEKYKRWSRGLGEVPPSELTNYLRQGISGGLIDPEYLNEAKSAVGAFSPREGGWPTVISADEARALDDQRRAKSSMLIAQIAKLPYGDRAEALSRLVGEGQIPQGELENVYAGLNMVQTQARKGMLQEATAALNTAFGATGWKDDLPERIYKQFPNLAGTPEGNELAGRLDALNPRGVRSRRLAERQQRASLEATTSGTTDKAADRKAVEDVTKEYGPRIEKARSQGDLDQIMNEASQEFPSKVAQDAVAKSVDGKRRQLGRREDRLSAIDDKLARAVETFSSETRFGFDGTILPAHSQDTKKAAQRSVSRVLQRKFAAANPSLSRNPSAMRMYNVAGQIRNGVYGSIDAEANLEFDFEGLSGAEKVDKFWKEVAPYFDKLPDNASEAILAELTNRGYVFDPDAKTKEQAHRDKVRADIDKLPDDASKRRILDSLNERGFFDESALEIKGGAQIPHPEELASAFMTALEWSQ